MFTNCNIKFKMENNPWNGELSYIKAMTLIYKDTSVPIFV